MTTAAGQTRGQLVRVVVGLGGNLGGEPAVRERLSRAVRALGHLAAGRGVQVSSLYRSALVGPGPEQPAFYNAAAAVELSPALAPVGFMAWLLELERTLGRERREAAGRARWHLPRAIDLDLLLWGALEARQDGPPAVVLPHPRLTERAFALLPLAELCGRRFRLPGGTAVGQYLERAAVARQPIACVAGPDWVLACDRAPVPIACPAAPDGGAPPPAR